MRVWPRQMDMAPVPAPDEIPACNPPGSSRLAAWIDPDTDGPDRYTIAPHDATDLALITQWMTVPAEWMWDLEQMR